MRKESLEFLKDLLTTPSPSGYESPNQKLWCQYARKYADEVRTDAYGNAMAVLNPDGRPKVMLDGHLDEIGMMIKHIGQVPRSNDGYVYFQRIGGVDPALVRGKRVSIHTSRGVVRGVVGATAIHLAERGKEPKVPKMHDLFIDIGAADHKAAEKRVSVGDPITFVDDFDMLTDHVATARAFDNRIGVWVAIEALRMAKAARPRAAIYACSSIQEETGLHGAQMQVANIKPDAAIVVDVTHATDTPGVDYKQHGEIKLGKGPSLSIGRENHPVLVVVAQPLQSKHCESSLSIGRENHPVLVDRLRKVAKRKKIDVQIETFSLTGGTDAYMIWTKNGGVPSAIVGVPNRYMHSTVETLDLRDLEATAKLLAAFVLDLKKTDKFVVKV